MGGIYAEKNFRATALSGLVGALLDYPFTYLVLWLGSLILGYRVTLTGLLVSSLLVATIEYILHLFIVDPRLKKD